MVLSADADPIPGILHAIQGRRVGQALATLESLVADPTVDRARLLAAVESLYALEDGMTRDQQDRLFRLEQCLREPEPPVRG